MPLHCAWAQKNVVILTVVKTYDLTTWTCLWNWNFCHLSVTSYNCIFCHVPQSYQSTVVYLKSDCWLTYVVAFYLVMLILFSNTNIMWIMKQCIRLGLVFWYQSHFKMNFFASTQFDKTLSREDFKPSRCMNAIKLSQVISGVNVESNVNYFED